LVRGAKPELSIIPTQAPFDVVFMDIQMKRMNGDVACKAALTNGLTIPLFAMSGNCSPAEVEGYLACGFTGALPKPFTLADLKRILDNLR
jgi:CheY-like chemotaxis protein